MLLVTHSRLWCRCPHSKYNGFPDKCQISQQIMALTKPRYCTASNLCCFQEFFPKLHIIQTCCTSNGKRCSRWTEIENNRASINIHTKQTCPVVVFLYASQRKSLLIVLYQTIILLLCELSNNSRLNTNLSPATLFEHCHYKLPETMQPVLYLYLSTPAWLYPTTYSQ